MSNVQQRARRAAKNVLMKVAPGAVGKIWDRRAEEIMERAPLHDFWRQRHPEGNVPEDYLHTTHRSEMLLELISDLPNTARILEVGCNVGRNLAYLHEHGYSNVTGVEISPHAVELLRANFPHLADAEIHVGPAEEVLGDFADDQFDLVFTMAVLEHIHPDSSMVFDEIVRCGRQVLAIEPGRIFLHRTTRQYPWDIPSEFTKRGLQEKSRTVLADLQRFEAEDADLENYVAWRFAP